MVQTFNSTEGRERGIHVTALSKGSVDDLIAALNASANEEVGAEKMPDIYQCYLDMAEDLDRRGLMIDLCRYMSSAELSVFVDAFVEEGRFSGDGSVRLFPVAKSTELLMINKTDWDTFSAVSGHTADELSTWEGLVRVAEDYYDCTGGKSFFGRDGFANYILVGNAQLGHSILRTDESGTTLALDKTVMRRLWDNYYIPYVRGYFGQNGRYRSDDIKTGSLIAQVCSTASAVYFASEVTRPDGSAYPIDYMLLDVPNFEGCEPYAVQQGASMAVAPSNETREYAAVVFLQWFTQESRNIAFAAEAGYLPVRKSACTTSAFEAYRHANDLAKNVKLDSIQLAIEQIEHTTLYTIPAFEHGTDIRNILEHSLIDLAVADRKAVTDALTGGTAEKDTLAPYLTDEHFLAWYENLSAELSAFISVDE